MASITALLAAPAKAAATISSLADASSTSSSPVAEVERFPLDVDPAYRLAGALVGVRPGAAWVEVDHVAGRIEARFGPWVVRTALDNVASAEVSGPYSKLKTIGPAHLSFADHGLTFATNDRRGVCLRFHAPVRGIDPLGAIRHPGLTVTVADPTGLVRALQADVPEELDPAGTVVEAEREEQAVEDRLHLLTARELRDLAEQRGIAHANRRKKAELVTLLEEDYGTRLVDEFPEELEELEELGDR